MTGAPIPPGADAVCMVERTVTEDGGAVVVVEGPVRPGEYVRLPGEDVKTGEVVIEAGTVLGPAHLGVLASLGAASVAVHRRPRVGVLSTGDELRHLGRAPETRGRPGRQPPDPARVGARRPASRLPTSGSSPTTRTASPPPSVKRRGTATPSSPPAG